MSSFFKTIKETQSKSFILASVLSHAYPVPTTAKIVGILRVDTAKRNSILQFLDIAYCKWYKYKNYFLIQHQNKNNLKCCNNKWMIFSIGMIFHVTTFQYFPNGAEYKCLNEKILTLSFKKKSLLKQTIDH